MSLPTARKLPAARQADLVEQRKPRNSHWLAGAGFVAPGVLIVAVVLYLPFLWTTYISLTEYDGLGDPEFVGLDNYPAMFADPALLNSVLNTLIWVAGTIVLPVGLGLLIAVLSQGLPTIFRMPFLIPYALSGVAVGVIWSFILQTGGARG